MLVLPEWLAHYTCMSYEADTLAVLSGLNKQTQVMGDERQQDPKAECLRVQEQLALAAASLPALISARTPLLLVRAAQNVITVDTGHGNMEYGICILSHILAGTPGGVLTQQLLGTGLKLQV